MTNALDMTPDASDFACECGAYPDGGTPSAPTYSACTCGAEADAEPVANAYNPWEAPTGNPDDAEPIWYERGEYDALTGAEWCAPKDAPTLAEAYREGWESVRLDGTPSEIGTEAVTPFQARALAVAEDAAEVLAHMEGVGVRFDAAAKVSDAETFTLASGGSSLAVPSKLTNVTAFQENIARIEGAVSAAGGYYPTRLHMDYGMILVLAEMTPGDPMSVEVIGQIQPKHEAWIGPVLRTGEFHVTTDDLPTVRCYVTAVTGGVPGKPTRGVNVVFTGAAQAIRERDRAEARAAQEVAAYGSGNVAAVEALLD